MTREEAKIYLESGKQLTHSTFIDIEFIGLKKVNEMRFIYDENGFLLPEKEFWKYRESSVFDNGWKFFN